VVTTNFAVIAGIGASGTPSMTPAIPLGFSAGFGGMRRYAGGRRRCEISPAAHFPLGYPAPGP
jgi:hypothetical protein